MHPINLVFWSDQMEMWKWTKFFCKDYASPLFWVCSVVHLSFIFIPVAVQNSTSAMPLQYWNWVQWYSTLILHWLLQPHAISLGHTSSEAENAALCNYYLVIERQPWTGKRPPVNIIVGPTRSKTLLAHRTSCIVTGRSGLTCVEIFLQALD